MSASGAPLTDILKRIEELERKQREHGWDSEPPPPFPPPPPQEDSGPPPPFPPPPPENE